MDKRMEDIISNDLGMPIGEIRGSSWNKLEKRHYKITETAFRPRDMFIVGGNINLSLKREMDMLVVSINEIIRKVNYKTKCLLKSMKNV